MGYTIRTIPYWIQLSDCVIFDIFKNFIDLDINKIKDYNLYPMGFIDKDCPLPATFCDLGIKETIREYKCWDKVIDKYYRYFDMTLLEKILEQDSFLKVANITLLPYFKTFFDNGGCGFEMSFNKACFAE